MQIRWMQVQISSVFYVFLFLFKSEGCWFESRHSKTIKFCLHKYEIFPPLFSSKGLCTCRTMVKVTKKYSTQKRRLGFAALYTYSYFMPGTHYTVPLRHRTLMNVFFIYKLVRYWHVIKVVFGIHTTWVCIFKYFNYFWNYNYLNHILIQFLFASYRGRRRLWWWTCCQLRCLGQNYNSCYTALKG